MTDLIFLCRVLVVTKGVVESMKQRSWKAEDKDARDARKYLPGPLALCLKDNLEDEMGRAAVSKS
jgi:hypothetical protein